MMKYYKKPPKTDRSYSRQLIQKGWKKIKEPKNFTTTLLASLPFAFFAGVLVLALLFVLNPDVFSFLYSKEEMTISFEVSFYDIGLFAGGVYVIMFLHEIIHALLIPDFFHSKNTGWGINGGFGFVFSKDVITKRRYLLISFAPFLILSMIFPLLLYVSDMLNTFTGFLCFINAVGSSIDLLTGTLIVSKTPKKSKIINNGYDTFYK